MCLIQEGAHIEVCSRSPCQWEIRSNYAILRLDSGVSTRNAFPAALMMRPTFSVQCTLARVASIQSLLPPHRKCIRVTFEPCAKLRTHKLYTEFILRVDVCATHHVLKSSRAFSLINTLQATVIIRIICPEPP